MDARRLLLSVVVSGCEIPALILCFTCCFHGLASVQSTTEAYWLCCSQLVLPSPEYSSQQNDTIIKDPYVALGICDLDLQSSRTKADLQLCVGITAWALYFCNISHMKRRYCPLLKKWAQREKTITNQH